MYNVYYLIKMKCDLFGLNLRRGFMFRHLKFLTYHGGKFCLARLFLQY